MCRARPRCSSSARSPSSPTSESFIDRANERPNVAGGADDSDSFRPGTDALRRVRRIDAADCHDRNRHCATDRAQPVQANRRVRVRLRRGRPDRTGADVVRAAPLPQPSFLNVRRRQPEDQPVRLRLVRARIVAAEMDTVGAEHERRLDVVVDDERNTMPRAEAARRAAALDDVDPRHVLQPPLHHRCAGFDRKARGLELVDEDVQPHEIFACESSVPGSRFASASYSPTWNVPGPRASRAASSAATPNAASASAAASSGASRLTARKQPVNALAMQPVPVTAASSSWPFATVSTELPSETWSTSPRILLAVSVRYRVAPAPTGSSTTGTPPPFAAFPASSIASTQ